MSAGWIAGEPRDSGQPPRIAVTGAAGFIGWHVRCAIRSRWGGDAIALDIAEFADPELLARELAQADAVIHLAGVNRAPSDDEVAAANPALAQQLVTALEAAGRVIPVIYGNSIHSLGDSVFGRAKRAAAGILFAWGERVGAPVVDVVMPNIFGEHGRPNYNSVVATFVHTIAAGGQPRVVDDKELPLIHVQRIAALLIDQAVNPTPGALSVAATAATVSQVAAELSAMAADYRTGILPDLDDPFTRELFNTYRAATFPHSWPIHPAPSSDPRGVLFEAVKARGGQAQVFYSATNPGFTRGQHYHLGKVERFLVLRGQAEIRLRRLFTDEVVTFPVSGDRPAIIDMPTMWAHSITNTGADELITLFYADELFDPARPDTYPEEV
ncbi:MAG: NAD-dependent epimerase/dehydratase family protein [Candidatus Nanopelagicales bacterium]